MNGLATKYMLLRELAIRKAREDIEHFARWTSPYIDLTEFHKAYYGVLTAFARGDIKRLIVSIPPQHGKSLGASQLLPAYLLGLDPDANVAIASYSASLASKFNKRAQRVMMDRSYTDLFPDTRLKSNSDDSSNSYAQTSDYFEVVGHRGSLMSVGREGSLTGNRVDCFILDDLYKDALEANSPIIRANCWEWYTSVVKTRMHNASRELIVFTRWHEEDLIGEIEKREKVVELTSLDQVEPGADHWYKLNLEAVKCSLSTPIDPRAEGVALWPERHGVALLSSKRKLDPLQFECMYQGHPQSREGLLYGDGFKTYTDLPNDIIRKANYTDTADMGDDNLCSICYEIDRAGAIYITDILFTQEPMEVTEPATAAMLRRNGTLVAAIESNNGGRGFARAVQTLHPDARIEWFHQGANKEARILTNAQSVVGRINFPKDWSLRWEKFHNHITTYKRLFRANRWHDAADVLTGIVERETTAKRRGIRYIGF